MKEKLKYIGLLTAAIVGILVIFSVEIFLATSIIKYVWY